MRDKMHWELRISPSVRRSEIFPIEKHPASGGGSEGTGNGARPGTGFTRGRESFAKTFPLINLVYRWAGSGDACALRSRQNLKYEELSKFTRDAARLRAAFADVAGYAVVGSNIDNWQETRVGARWVGSHAGNDFGVRRAVTESRPASRRRILAERQTLSRGNNRWY